MYGSATRTTEPRCASTSSASASSLVARVRAGADPGDALVHDRGRVRHRPDDGHRRGQQLLEQARRDAAATESTVCSVVTRPPISPSSASMSWGFTAITSSAASRIASAFDSVGSTP